VGDEFSYEPMKLPQSPELRKKSREQVVELPGLNFPHAPKGRLILTSQPALPSTADFAPP